VWTIRAVNEATGLGAAFEFSCFCFEEICDLTLSPGTNDVMMIIRCVVEA